MSADYPSDQSAAQEGFIPIAHAEIYYRVLGQGQPLLILHGGPDFDHTYLLPDMDRLADAFQLIYYDQRGRGKSAAHVQPEEVSLISEMHDVESVMDYLGLETAAVLGHSYGGILAMEYAIRHPARVSHLILMNTAPASYDDWTLLRKDRHTTTDADLEQMRMLASTPEYEAGDPDTASEYYRIHYRSAVRHPEHLERLMRSLRASFTKEGILKARAIEHRLDAETRLSSEFDLLPHLRHLHLPTLVLHGDADKVPIVCAEHIAQSIPGARFVVLPDCAHFSYLESPDQVRTALVEFFA